MPSLKHSCIDVKLSVIPKLERDIELCSKGDTKVLVACSGTSEMTQTDALDVTSVFNAICALVWVGLASFGGV